MREAISTAALFFAALVVILGLSVGPDIATGDTPHPTVATSHP